MRRNLVVQLVALVVAVVLGVVAVWWTLRLDWQPYQDTLPSEPTRVRLGEASSLGDVAFTVTDAVSVDGDGPEAEELGLAPDTRLVVVSLEVTPGDAPRLATCTLDLVAADGDGDGDTEWQPADYMDTTYSPPDRFESYCDDEATEPYLLQAYYVVPDDAEGPWRLRVTELRQLPKALELELGGLDEPDDVHERSR